MEVREVSTGRYRELFPKPQLVYNSVDFAELNAHKVDRIVWAVAFDQSDSAITGLVIGVKGDELYAPFSAPFTCFDYNRDHRTMTILEAAAAFVARYRGLTLTLPPALYFPSAMTKMQLALQTVGARIECNDWNYHIDLTDPYDLLLRYNARKKLRKAHTFPLRLEQCAPPRAYTVIATNRREHGYELSMTLGDVLRTVAPQGPVKADFFVLTDGATDVAAAMVYKVTERVAQVIYWGDCQQDRYKYVMNLLAELLADHYRRQGFAALDIGPSGHDGIPSPGLSAFKDSIGCYCSAKPTLRF